MNEGASPLGKVDLGERAGAPSLADLAYRRLEEAIVTLSLRPGAILTEAQMIDLVGVGRTPVREALIRLAQQGMVEILPRKGVAVTDINAIDVMAALDAREVLERLIAAEAARRAGPAERIAILEKARAMRQVAQDGDVNAYMRLDKEFDAAVAAAARSPYATRAAEPLQALIRRAWYFFERQDDLMPAAAQHVAFAQALASGQPEAAMAASDTLMQHLRAGLMATLGRE